MKVRIAVLMFLCILITVPRFAMWDPWPVSRLTTAARTGPYGHPVDVEGYERLVEYLRGESPADSMLSPFCYRPLAPALAAWLPVSPAVAINLINLVGLLACVLLTELVAAELGLRARSRWATGLLFVISFPTFYYGTIGFIDPVALAFISLLLLLTLREASLRMLVPISFLAALAKETAAVFVMLPLAMDWAGRGLDRRRLLQVAILGVTAIAAHVGWRVLADFPGQGYLWLPGLANAAGNLLRPRTAMSFMLTTGLPAGLGLLAWRSGRASAALGPRAIRVLTFGMGLAVFLYVYSVLSAYTDGRIIWIIYPFLIPIAATWFSGGGQERRAFDDTPTRA